MPDLKPVAGDFAIGPPRDADLKFVLAEDFSILVFGTPRIRRIGDKVVLLH